MSNARIEPRRHQIEAHGSLMSGLEGGDRVQANMCCGSGKTYTQGFLAREFIEAAERQGESATIVCLVPNRDLIGQNAENFRRVLGEDVDFLGVCSPQEGASSSADQDLPLTTDRDEIRRFADRKGPKVIFTTYQSAMTTRDGLEDASGDVRKVSLGLFDEAHRTAGDKTTDSQFALALLDDNFPMEKRAFFTATPRISAREGQDGPQEVLSMSDPELYGPRVYEYPFSQGIKDGVVVDYDLWVPVVHQSEIRRHIGSDEADEASMREAVAELALGKVMEETGQTRFLTYHSRIEASKRFADKLEERYGPEGFTVGHIDGSTPSSRRRELLSAMAGGKAVVTNCKAFMEGTDAPGLQGALFVDPKKSVVDVVQAMGRLSRPDPNDANKRGSVIAPIIVGDEGIDGLADQAQAQGFGTLINVVEALRANDNTLADEIRSRSRQAGRSGSFGEGAFRNLKVVGLGEDISDADVEKLEKSITMVSLNAVRDGFAEKVGQLEAHIAKHGELPTSKTDRRLSAWVRDVVRRRHREGTLEPENARMMESMEGWTWVGPRAAPEEAAQHISAFYDRNRVVPDRFSENGAERDLGRSLREGEQMARRLDEFGHGADAKSPKKALHDELAAKGMLFKGSEEGDHSVTGRVEKTVNPETGQVTHHFHPTQQLMPAFKSGIMVNQRPVKLHVSQDDRERLDALGEKHALTVTLKRAGKEKAAFEDGAIEAWHDMEIDRGDRPGGSTKVGFLINRLKDRKVSGLPSYEAKNFLSGEVDADAPATTYSKEVDPATCGKIRSMMNRVQKRGSELKPGAVKRLDACPGFAWVEPEKAPGLLAPAVSGVVERHGAKILSDMGARKGDSGLANTLRNTDAILARKQEIKGLDEDLDALAKAGHLVPLMAVQKRARDLASETGHKKPRPDQDTGGSRGEDR